MKKNLDTPILRLDGKEYEDKPTLGILLFTTIQNQMPNDQQLDITKKMALYRLAQKVVVGGIVDFSTDELALAKERAGTLPPVIMGPVFDLLDADYKE